MLHASRFQRDVIVAAVESFGFLVKEDLDF